ncbi:MAG: polyphosphate:AMP phosphotransferase [Lachnospiraceae bacterium]|nr:polyphosphate:AMP phosphotransferase [Lachnospiraceae bacterium]
MLKNYEIRKYQMPQEEIKALIKEKREELFCQQQLIKEHKLPVFVLIEGWGAAGKGTLIGNLIKELDPRFFRVINMDVPAEKNTRKPFLWRYMETIPEAGKFVFLDSAWLDETAEDVIKKRIDEETLEKRMQQIRTFDRQLKDNGYLVVKLFLQIPEEEQKKRLDKLMDTKDTKWRVAKKDIRQMEKRKQYEDVFDRILEATNTGYVPWNIVDAVDKKQALLQVLHILTNQINQAVENSKVLPEILHKDYPLLKMPKLSEVPLNQEMTKEEYQIQLKTLQKKLKKLHNKIYRKKVPVIIAYEGWDAAGKGGNIKRLTSALDPRGFEVHPIASPEPHEKARHYLWRFYHRLPKDGHIAIFDRTWYGRVMVERLEGFCSENDWKRAYNEMNEFEKELSDWGAVVIKFWVHIDKDTQLARFTDRQNNPEKQWKITEEDWRNREKWDVYEEAIDEMIAKTSTENAPWYIIQSNNKYYARIQAIQIVIDEIEKKLGKKRPL